MQYNNLNGFFITLPSNILIDMDKLTITAPLCLKARIQLPSSKSISNRVLIMNALGKGEMPQNLSDCDDTRVTVEALTHLDCEELNILAAGTAMRFLTAFLAATSGTHVLTGTARMRQRPIRVLVDALRSLGAQIDYTENEGFPPLRITGCQLTGHTISLPGDISSQYISALLMVGPVLPQGLHITLTGNIVSVPYINLTLQLMRDFGAQADWTSPCELQVQPQPYQSVPFYVESDWSAASYWYQMVALAPEAEIELPDLFTQSYQGDSQVAQLFTQLGVDTCYQDNKVILRKSNHCVNRMECNLVNQPDLAQTFVVTCALKGIPFRFTGLQSLKIKETDRIEALITELHKLGYVVHQQDDSILYWDGERCEPHAQDGIDTYEDHRMAMAFAPAALVLPRIVINNPQVVTKSYPHYWDDLTQAGFSLTPKA